ncbi:Signal transduction histidine kinase [Ekhidna lutea]|uniref:histidine kinase n=1 Tax=Ekhidna lutea TaxID=447679 RepID=A0A239GVA1_EKHLU|nr:tetratricopeptide repeat protein [Ekhidna lutea]SNS71994.1 Signal transduction histidine kinase [Ekhidna lutea]
MKGILFLFLYLFILFGSVSQKHKLDSLQSLFSEHDERDSLYVDLANEISFQLGFLNPQELAYYNNLAISVAESINYERGLLRATIIKGSSFLISGLPDQALSHYLKALSYNPQQYPMDNMRINNNIGEVYRRKEVYDSSIKYFNKALTIANEELPNFKPDIIYSNLGEVSLMQGKVDSAKMYFKNCLDLAIESNHFRGQGYGYFGLAECEFRGNNFNAAIQLMRKSIESREQAGHQRGLIQSYLKIAEYFLKNRRTESDSALYYWKLSENLAKTFDAYDLLNSTYNQLYKFHLDRNDISNAAIYLEKHKNLDDSIRNAEFISNVEKMQAALQAELVESENKLLRQEQQQRKIEEEARLIVIILAFFIVIGLGISTFQYRKRQRLQSEAQMESSFTKSLLSLSNELNKRDLDLDFFLQSLLNLSSEVLYCDRATYWAMNDEKQEIFLHSITQKKNVPKIPPVEFSRHEFPRFFDDFLKNRTVAVSRISKDERLADIYEKYFKHAGIESILNAPIIIDSKFVGFISYTMTRGKIREWDVQEQRYVGSLADLIVAAIAKHRGNRLEIEKEELIQKLKSRNASLQEFNSVISHNLREPLTQIIGFSDLLQDSSNGIKNSNEIISRIGKASNKIDKVIKELSTVLNESDPEPSDFKVLSLEHLTKEVLDLLKAEIKSQSMTIEQDLQVEKIKTYKPFLSDALYHILSNSIKFADPDKRLLVKIQSYEDELHHYIKVSDNGLGMDMNKFGDKIFKMYQRFHIKTEGRGMGLFIVKNRVNALNGWVRVESEEGIGSAFTFEFPKEILPVS